MTKFFLLKMYPQRGINITNCITYELLVLLYIGFELIYACMHACMYVFMYAYIFIFICQVSEKSCHIKEVYHFLIIYSLITYLFCSLRLSISALAKKIIISYIFRYAHADFPPYEIWHYENNLQLLRPEIEVNPKQDIVIPLSSVFSVDTQLCPRVSTAVC